MIAVNISERRPRGLIVTRNDRVQDAASAAMAAEGMECEAATSAELGLACAQRCEFAVILCDDDCFRNEQEVGLIDLRAVNATTRIIYLLDGHSANLFSELRKRISEALAWLTLPGQPQAPTGVDRTGIDALLSQASPMAALHLNADNVILSCNDVASYSGCHAGASLPALGAFPMCTWSLAESQAAHARMVGLAQRDLGLSDQVPTRLFALRCSRIDHHSVLMTACEIADADDELNQATRILTPREERLQALEGFACGLAQEFAGLLGIVSGCSHLLRMRFPRSEDDPGLQSVAQPLETAVRQGTALIARLRAFGRQGPLTRQCLNAVELLRDWSRAVRSMVIGDIGVEIDSDRMDYPIVGNRQALHEALMQLSGNAIDAIRMSRKPAPTIRLRARIDSLSDGTAAVAITISDNGNGIEESIRERIFDPFFSSKPSGTAKGLGLAMVSGTIRGHGGEVSFSSRAGEGSEFTIKLPIGSRDDVGLSKDADRPRLVLIDEDALALEVNLHALRGLGCDAVGGSTAEFAMAAFKGPVSAFMAVVVVAGADSQSGIDIAASARNAGVPTVVFICSNSQASAPFLRHADRILYKPCSAWDLLEAIRQFDAAKTRPERDST